MKKLNEILLISLFAISAILSLTAFTSLGNSDSTIKIESLGDNSCTLSVETSYGSPAKSVKVTTDVSGGISCVGGRSFYTDSNGEVTLKWVSGCYLKKVYIKGRGYDVNFKDGNSYTVRMR